MWNFFYFFSIVIRSTNKLRRSDQYRATLHHHYDLQHHRYHHDHGRHNTK